MCVQVRTGPVLPERAHTAPSWQRPRASPAALGAHKERCVQQIPLGKKSHRRLWRVLGLLGSGSAPRCCHAAAAWPPATPPCPGGEAMRPRSLLPVLPGFWRSEVPSREINPSVLITTSLSAAPALGAALPPALQCHMWGARLAGCWVRRALRCSWPQPFPAEGQLSPSPKPRAAPEGGFSVSSFSFPELQPGPGSGGGPEMVPSHHAGQRR